MRLGAALDWAAKYLSDAGVEQPRREARLLAAHLLGAAPGALLDQAAEIDWAGYAAFVARRGRREPMAFITGRRGFWTLELEVSPDTLVPRPDSESLVEAALAHARAPRRVLDLGTGTGCLLLAVLAERPDAFGVGVDIAPGACRLAARNAAANGLGGRCAFVAGDWASALRGRFDLILCNPPYIETSALAGLMPEVRLFEPARALDGGERGLDAYWRLLPGLAALLEADGIAVIEVGVGQEAAVRALAEEAGLDHRGTGVDLGQVPRAVVLTRADTTQKVFGRTAPTG